MIDQYLDFEQPIAEIESKIIELQNSESLAEEQVKSELIKLNESAVRLTEKIYSKLSPWQQVQVARHPSRPHFADYVRNITDSFDELHGDRKFGDDRAIVGGIATLGNYNVMLIGHEKGRSTDEKIQHNFGMSQPEGYRKAYRLMKLAERFKLPVVTLIDTPGAYPGIESEERGQSEAIANNLRMMSSLETPIIVNIVGEGGSGGALALGVGDHISMMQYATYSVASPEACASIVWRDSSRAPEAAEAMKLNAENLLEINLIDEIIKEPLGGAHRNPEQSSHSLKTSIVDNLEKLLNSPTERLIEKRYDRLMSYGSI
tara:strand:- start:114465 stop:115415 length:951 start_codon:yes stop_codon:yes gene_type:complete